LHLQKRGVYDLIAISALLIAESTDSLDLGSETYDPP